MKNNEAKGVMPTVYSTATLGGALDTQKLVDIMLEQHWHKHCEVIDGYMPPYPGSGRAPTCVVRYAPFNCFLRYSNGPRQGFFWDIYGDDLHNVELALVALSEAPAPRDCSPITFKLPLRASNT